MIAKAGLIAVSCCDGRDSSRTLSQEATRAARTRLSGKSLELSEVLGEPDPTAYEEFTGFP